MKMELREREREERERRRKSKGRESEENKEGVGNETMTERERDLFSIINKSKHTFNEEKFFPNNKTPSGILIPDSSSIVCG